MSARQQLTIPLMVLVRPRTGDFVHDTLELETMRRDVEVARALEADGVVLGVLRPDDAVDTEAMRMLIDAARPMTVTFHRAIDAARDPIEALETLLALGVDRVLSSGGAPTAREGTRTLGAMVRRAGDDCVVMAGGRVRPDHAAALVRETGVREVHARLVTRLEDGREETSEAAVREMIEALGG
jgi:copper homeostasis protein